MTENAENGARTLRGTLMVLLAGCCFGSIGPLTIIARREGASVQTVQAWRYIVAAALLVSIGRYLDNKRKLKHNAVDHIPKSVYSNVPNKRPWFHPLILLTAGSGQSVVATLSLWALDWVTAATAAFLFYTFPVWVTIITAARGIERITPVRIVALLVALSGIAAMVGTPSAGNMHPAGVALAVGAAIIYAAYIPVLGVLQQGREPLDIARAISTGGALLFSVWAFSTTGLFYSIGIIEWLASAGQGVLSAIAFLGFLGGLRILGPVRAAITSTIEPFWTTLLGVLILSQPAGSGTVIGGIAIVVAVLLLQMRVRTSAAT